MRLRHAAADVDAVRVAVAAVLDPELHLPIGELGMVRAVRSDRSAVVTVEIALTTASCPLADELAAAVSAAVAGVPRVSGVQIEFGVLSERERMELAQQLRGSSGGPIARRIYAVASGKGGVGKSSVTANLAVALAAAGQKVGVLDADVWGYSVPQLFGVTRSPTALKGLMLPIEAHGVQLMSTGFFVADGQPIVWRGPMLHKALQQFIEDVFWGELDVLLLDLPPGTGDITLSLLELLPDAALLAVTTPQVAAATVAARVGRMALDMRMPVAGVVENMSAAVCGSCSAQTAVFGSGGGARLAAELNVPLLGQVPLDIALRDAGDRGVPVVIDAPSSASATELRRIAEVLPVVRRSLLGRSLPLHVL